MVRPGVRFSVLSGLSVLAVVAAGAAAAGSTSSPDATRPSATARVSLSGTGAQADAASISPVVSATGRYVGFMSSATNLVPGDTNGVADIFVRDRVRGVTRRVSVNSRERQANAASNIGSPAISADGRYVVFSSRASNLVRGDTNGRVDVFVRDRQRGTTERVSVSGHEAQGNRRSGFDNAPSAISATGRYVVFSSEASNLVRNDTNGHADVFVRDRETGQTRRVSVSTAKVQADAESFEPAISDSGRYVAFVSAATNLIKHDTNQQWDVFVRDLVDRTTRRASVSTSHAEADGQSMSPAISGDGTRIVFTSWARNLVSGDTNRTADVFLRDLTTHTTRLMSLSSREVQGTRRSYSPAISGNGRFVAFESLAPNLVRNDTNRRLDVFIRDLGTGTTRRASLATGGVQGNGLSELPDLTNGGRLVVFQSDATNLVTGDTNAAVDVFVRYMAP